MEHSFFYNTKIIDTIFRGNILQTTENGESRVSAFLNRGRNWIESASDQLFGFVDLLQCTHTMGSSLSREFNRPTLSPDFASKRKISPK